MLDLFNSFLQGFSMMFFIATTLYIYFYSRRTESQTLLMYCFVCLAVLYAKDFIFMYMLDRRVDEVLAADYVLPDLAGVFFAAFYLLGQLFPEKMTIKFCVYGSIPLIIGMIVWGIYISFNPIKHIYNVSDIFTYIWNFDIMMRLLCVVYTFIYGSAVGLYVFFKIPAYERKLQENYSNTDKFSLRWLQEVVVLLAMCMCVYYFIVVYASQIGNILYYVFSLFIFGIVFWKAIHQKNPLILRVRNTEEPEVSFFKFSQNQENIDFVSDNKLREIFNRLEKVFNEQELYLQPQLNIVDLAAACRTNRTYLSQLFNEKLNCSFYDYVNRRRIEEKSLKLLIDEEKMYSLEEVAEASGFGSLSTFRRAFTKYMGMTPKQYREQNCKLREGA